MEVLIALALVVSCAPAQVLRGETVTCAAHVEPTEPFVIVELLAVADGHVLRDPAEKRVDGVFRWSGPAVTDTVVTISARSRAGERVSGSAAFTVLEREFPRVMLPNERPPWEYGDNKLFARGIGTTLEAKLGAMKISLATPRTKYVDEGPDARWFYVAEPVPQPEVQIVISTALRGARWSGCSEQEMKGVLDDLLRHEGALESSQPSHWTETQQTLAERNLQGEVEEMRLFYDEAVTGDPLGKLVSKKLQDFLDALRIAQRESVDGTAPIKTRCRL